MIDILITDIDLLLSVLGVTMLFVIFRFLYIVNNIMVGIKIIKNFSTLGLLGLLGLLLLFIVVVSVIILGYKIFSGGHTSPSFMIMLISIPFGYVISEWLMIFGLKKKKKRKNTLTYSYIM